MKIIKHRETTECVEYRLVFDYIDTPGAGFSFPCDEHGNVGEDDLPPAGLKNLQRCRMDQKTFTKGKVEKYCHRYTSPTVGECVVCGEEVELSHFTNTCSCGADYNHAGQRLAPRECWGEETGETAADILGL